MSTDTTTSTFKGEVSEIPRIMKAIKKHTESPIICGDALKALAQIFEKSGIYIKTTAIITSTITARVYIII